jgi:energy-coupling factor transport system permease protein
VTVERSFFAVSQFVRVFSIAIMTILIPYSLNPAHYGITFKGLGMSDKIAYAMDLTMRFIPTFGRDFQMTMDAQRARGYEIEKISGGMIEQVRKLGPIIVPVTIHAIIGSEDIIDAMDLRAFGVGPRTWLVQLIYAAARPNFDCGWLPDAVRFGGAGPQRPGRLLGSAGAD